MSIDKSAQIEALRREAAQCLACPLWENATQTVFGEGAGAADGGYRVRRRAARRPGRPRRAAFRRPRGSDVRQRRWRKRASTASELTSPTQLSIYKRPNAGEINVCRRWLFAGIEVLKPTLAVALGATAGQSLAGIRSRSGRTAAVRSRLQAGCACS
jgi:uracil-DNA glycosylase